MEDKHSWMAARHIASVLSELGINTDGWKTNVATCTDAVATELSANCSVEELNYLNKIVQAALKIEKKG